MVKIQSQSDKRLIIECKVNDKYASFLIDTGASIALIDKSQRKKYNLAVGRDYPGAIVGAGGHIDNPKICDTIVYIANKAINQFVLADIDLIVNSVKRETGITILGIISLPQMKFAGINIDTNDNMIMIE